MRSAMRRLPRLATVEGRYSCHDRCTSRQAFSSSSYQVSIVYGSFCQDNSLMDAEHIGEYMQTHFDSTETGAELRISDPIEGDQFDFESLGDTDYLIVSVSYKLLNNCFELQISKIIKIERPRLVWAFPHRILSISPTSSSSPPQPIRDVLITCATPSGATEVCKKTSQYLMVHPPYCPPLMFCCKPNRRAVARNVHVDAALRRPPP